MSPNAPYVYNNPTVSSGGALPGQKKRLLFGGVIVMVLALAAAFVFAYYLPNRPNSVFKTGLDRSGKALNMFVDATTQKAKLDAFKKTEMTAKVDATYQGGSFSGTLTSKFDPTHLDSGLDITAKSSGDASKVFSARLLAQLQKNSQYPDIYFKLSGLKNFGLDVFLPAIDDYDGKWIAIDSSYLKSLGAPPITANDTKKKQITADDVTEFTKATSAVTADYVLTSSPQRAVLEQKKFIAKETVDGISAYHYEVGINKQHAKDYCQALINKLYETQLLKKMNGDESADSLNSGKKNEIESCQRSAGDIKDDTTFDLWVNAKNKVIYKARFAEKNNNDAYTEVGQNSSGLDNISLFINFHDGKAKTDAKFSLDTNLNTNTTQGVFTVVSKSSDGGYNIKVSLEAKPYKGDIKVSKPNGAIPISEVLKKFGIDPSLFAQAYAAQSSSSGLQSKARDTERTTDIKALHGQIEAYYAQYGKYPTLANLNDASWRQHNMIGLDNEALKDPQGSSYTLASKPATHVYSYQVTASNGATCDNKTKDCAKYTLTATLEAGGTFTKANLN